MIKKLGLAAALSLLAAPAFAACTNPLSIKDGSAATVTMSVIAGADTFCLYNFNMALINGVTPLMGNGATGTGSPRVTLASDNTIPTGWPTAANQTAASAARGQGATGASVPAGAQYVGLNSGGNLLGWAAKAGNTYSSTDVVPGVAVVNTTPLGQASPTASSPVVTALQSIAGGATFVSGTTAAMTGTTSTQIIALVASNRIYVTRIKCNNSSGVATLVQIRDGSAGTVLDTLAAGATYGGEQGTGSTPLFWTTAGTALYAQNVTTSASVICTASGYSAL